MAVSPDGGAVFGAAPVNVMVDLSTGATKQFTGYNNGAFHAGYVNGLAVDPNTGVGATTTELNSQVEFYDMAKRKALTFAQLPCTNDTDQTNSGSNIAVDPVNKLFLVTDYFYCDGSQGSAIVVYDEAGNFVETITGFNFAIGEPAPVLNPGQAHGLGVRRPFRFQPVAAVFLLTGNCGRSATPELIRRVVNDDPRLAPRPDCGCPTAWRRSAPKAAVEIGNIPEAKCQRDLADAASVATQIAERGVDAGKPSSQHIFAETATFGFEKSLQRPRRNAKAMRDGLGRELGPARLRSICAWIAFRRAARNPRALATARGHRQSLPMPGRADPGHGA